MKKNKFYYLSLVIFLVVLITSSPILAQSWGIGIMIGEPTGISYKIWQNKTIAWAGGVAWALGQQWKLHLHADYLFHNYNFHLTKEIKIITHLGLGGKFKIEESAIGIRVPLGLNYIFANAPLDCFFEIVPILDLIPATEFWLGAALGVRLYFKR